MAASSKTAKKQDLNWNRCTTSKLPGTESRTDFKRFGASDTITYNETLHQLHFLASAIISGVSLASVVFLIIFAVRVECQQRPHTFQPLLINALLILLLLCEFVHAFLIALSNYYYFIEPSIYQAVAYLVLAAYLLKLHKSYVIVHVTPIISPIPGILFVVACFHPLPNSIIAYSILTTTLFTMGIDLVFICVFAGQIRAMQSGITVNPALVIIARYGLLANSIGISGIVCFILGYIFSGNSPGGVGHVVFSFFTQIFVFLMCMACLVMKVKLVRLKDGEDVAYSGLADDTHFRNNQHSKK